MERGTSQSGTARLFGVRLSSAKRYVAIAGSGESLAPKKRPGAVEPRPSLLPLFTRSPGVGLLGNQASGVTSYRKPSFRCMGFPETRQPPPGLGLTRAGAGYATGIAPAAAAAFTHVIPRPSGRSYAYGSRSYPREPPPEHGRGVGGS